MKKITAYLLVAFVLLTIVPVQVKAESVPVSTTATTAEAAQAEVLISRLNEIKAMDKSEMSFTQKRQLRKEVRSINESLNSSGGIYLSVGAIIIIVLLLVILL